MDVENFETCTSALALCLSFLILLFCSGWVLELVDDFGLLFLKLDILFFRKKY